MSARKKIRPKEDPPLLDDLFGESAARRLRIGSLLLILLLFAGGSALYVLESQTFGKLLLAPALGWASFWVLLRGLGDRDPIERVRSLRVPLMAVGAVLFVLGWVAFFTVHQDLGLLLVVLGSFPFLVIASFGGVSTDPIAAASSPPFSGPPFGETDG